MTQKGIPAHEGTAGVSRAKAGLSKRLSSVDPHLIADRAERSKPRRIVRVRKSNCP